MVKHIVELLSHDGNFDVDESGDVIPAYDGVNSPRMRPMDQQWPHDMYPAETSGTNPPQTDSGEITADTIFDGPLPPTAGEFRTRRQARVEKARDEQKTTNAEGKAAALAILDAQRK